MANISSAVSGGVKKFLGINADDPKTAAVKKRDKKKYNLAKMPAKDDPEVGKFFGELYEGCIAERDRLGMPTRWMAKPGLPTCCAVLAARR